MTTWNCMKRLRLAADQREIILGPLTLAVPTVKAKERTMEVLMVPTSHDRLGDTGRKTGFWWP